MKDFMDSEKAMIKNMALTKSHKQIADLMDCEVIDVAELIKQIFYKDNGVQTYQDKIDQHKPARPAKPKKKVIKKSVKFTDPELEKKRVAREKQALIANQQNEMKAARKERSAPKFATKKIDYSKMKLIPVDKKTSIYVDPTKNIRQQVEAFKNGSYKKYFE